MRPFQLALMLSSALFAHAAAHAGDVTLFSGYDMTGREAQVRADISTLQGLGFNDRTMSMVIHSGRWEVCTDADFRGECRVFNAGPHRDLDRFTNQISSLRQIDDDRRNDRGRGRNRGGEQSVMLFDSADMRGRSVALRSDANTFVALGFNDMTQSMVIRGGTWEFCQHSDFRGQCRVFGPGEYRNLDRAFNRSISSARQIGERGERGDRDERGERGDRGERRGDYGQRDGYGDGRDGSAVELFAGQGYGGQRVALSSEMRSLDEVNFNDRTGAIVIQSGQWEFCEHADFRGQCQVFGPGRYDRLGTMHNAISSLRRVR